MINCRTIVRVDLGSYIENININKERKKERKLQRKNDKRWYYKNNRRCSSNLFKFCVQHYF